MHIVRVLSNTEYPFDMLIVGTTVSTWTSMSKKREKSNIANVIFNSKRLNALPFKGESISRMPTFITTTLHFSGGLSHCIKARIFKKTRPKDVKPFLFADNCLYKKPQGNNKNDP